MNESLRRARLRLTAWYVGVFAAILFLFGSAIYVAVTRQIRRVLDDQLVSAAAEVQRAMDIRERERGVEGAVDALQELRLPGRDWYIVGEDGRSLGPTAPSALMEPFLRAALTDGGPVWGRPEGTDEEGWRVYARPFDVGGRRYAVLVAAEAVELENRYAGLMASFLLAGLGALVLVAVGGASLAHRALAPVDGAMGRMRNFIADASHELRTPTAALRTRAEVALQRARTVEEYQAIVRKFRGEALRLGHLVDGLFVLAASDDGRLTIRPRPVFLDDLLVEASEAVSAIAAAKEVTLELERFEEAPIEADPDLVTQLIIILLENAVKYTPSSGAVRASVLADQSMSTLAVDDTGPGIAPDMLPHVFERFYRAARSGSAEGGSGIGLAIAKTIADAHGADIRLTSELGKGTSVRVSFPRRGTALVAGLVVALAAGLAGPGHASAQQRMTLQEALASVDAAPEVEAAVADSAALAAGVDLARAFPNPLLALGYSKSVPRHHVEVELPIDYPWLRGPRVRSAVARAAAGGLNADVIRAQRRYDIELAYGQVVGTLALLELSEQAVADGGELVGIVEAREANGDAAALDVAVARVALGNLRSALVSDSLAAFEASVTLRSVVGSSVVPSDSLAQLWVPEEASDRTALRLLGADSTVAAEQAGLTLARRARIPVPALRVGFEQGDPGGSETGILPTFGISIPLPLFDRGGAGVAEARASVRRAEAERAMVERDVRAAADRAGRRWEAALRRLEADDAAVAEALRVADLVQEAYREGAYPLASVLEAQQSAREAMRRRIEDLIEARAAAAARRFSATAGGFQP